MLTEMDKLAAGLDALGLDYKRRALFDGEQIICGDWDAICRQYSYGGDEGLLEIMGPIVSIKDDEVEGWLTAEEILNRL